MRTTAQRPQAAKHKKPRLESERPDWSPQAEAILTRRDEYVPRPRHIDPITLWLNELLEPLGMSVKYVDEDLRDGVVFIKLIEAHSDFKFAENRMVWHAQPETGAEKLKNNQHVVTYLTNELHLDLGSDRADTILMVEQASYRVLLHIAKHFNLGDPTYISRAEVAELTSAPAPKEKLDVMPVAERQMDVSGLVVVKCIWNGSEDKQVQLPLRSNVGTSLYIMGAAFGHVVSDVTHYEVQLLQTNRKWQRLKYERTLLELGVLNGSYLQVVFESDETQVPLLLRVALDDAGDVVKGLRVFQSDSAMIATFKVWEQHGDRDKNFIGYGLKFNNKILNPIKTLAAQRLTDRDLVNLVIVDEDVAARAAASSGEKRVSEDTHLFLRVVLEETGQAKTIAFEKDQTVTATMNEIGVKFGIINVSDYLLRHDKRGLLKPQKTLSALKLEQRDQISMCLQKGRVRESGALDFNVDAILPPEWNAILYVCSVHCHRRSICHS